MLSRSVLLCWKTILVSHTLGVVATCAIVVSAWALHKTYYDKLVTLNRQKDAEMKLAAKKPAIQAAYIALQPKLEELQQFNKDLLNRIPPNAKETEFLQQISNLANGVGLDIQDFRPGQVANQPPLQSKEVQLRCAGDFASICNFINRLAKLPRICRITQLNINEPKDVGGKCAMDIQIQIIFGSPTPTNNPETLAKGTT